MTVKLKVMKMELARRTVSLYNDIGIDIEDVLRGILAASLTCALILPTSYLPNVAILFFERWYHRL